MKTLLDINPYSVDLSPYWELHPRYWDDQHYCELHSKNIGVVYGNGSVMILFMKARKEYISVMIYKRYGVFSRKNIILAAKKYINIELNGDNT